jgi:hypothetical protein
MSAIIVWIAFFRKQKSSLSVFFWTPAPGPGLDPGFGGEATRDVNESSYFATVPSFLSSDLYHGSFAGKLSSSGVGFKHHYDEIIGL